MNKTDYLLITLAEECGEVIQAVSKALRFGLDDHAPDSLESNAERIVKELSDLKGVEIMLIDEGVIRSGNTKDVFAKIDKVEKWMMHSKLNERLK
ncbi:MAG: hypothetical protein LBQ73_11295 [Tannerellaceae bacterium]|jgi:NTP pyrophosphatase (non-canonical NTP hydrolase)|nr:hypothetical protein [Tannerellaceae bacterium]